MPRGTRICVFGADGWRHPMRPRHAAIDPLKSFGLGTVTGFDTDWRENTIEFDRGLTTHLALQNEGIRWAVQKGEMEQLDVEQCFWEVTGEVWPGNMGQREAEDSMQQWMQLWHATDGEPCTEEKIKQAIRISEVAAPIVVKRRFRELTAQEWPCGMEQREADENLQTWVQLLQGADGETPCTDEQLKQAIRSTDGLLEAAAVAAGHLTVTESGGQRRLEFAPCRGEGWDRWEEVEWRVPPGVTAVTIEATGAQGGGGFLSTGGAGARVRGVFALGPGTALRLRAGGAGSKPDWDGGCSDGGGGSWAVAADGSPLVVAGGGAGGGDRDGGGAAASLPGEGGQEETGWDSSRRWGISWSWRIYGEKAPCVGFADGMGGHLCAKPDLFVSTIPSQGETRPFYRDRWRSYRRLCAADSDGGGFVPGRSFNAGAEAFAEQGPQGPEEDPRDGWVVVSYRA